MEVAKQQRASLGSLSSLPPDGDEPDPRYRAVLDWVWSFSARPRTPAELTAQRAAKLERMRALLAALGSPQLSFPSILVAGTKGKGSTVAMISACLTAGGLRTGRYTSPHLVNWRERACVDGHPISTDAVLKLAEPMRRAVGRLPGRLGAPTTFEVGTAFALAYFAQQQAAVAVLEVGTGGRFDATNVVDPLAATITPISYDHTATLGESLSAIAWHKAGIMRAGRPAVAAPQPEEARLVIEREASLVGAHLEEVGREWHWSPSREAIRVESSRPGVRALTTGVALLGEHQRDNATTAVATLHALQPHFAIDAAAIQRGLSTVDWPGRLQVLSERPLLVVDGAHNGASADALRRAIRHEFRFDRLILILGLSEGKDARGVVGALAPDAEVVCLTRSHHERAADPSELEPLVRSVAPRATIARYEAVSGALGAVTTTARTSDLMLVTGSLFLVGEALVWWRRSPR
jgi:dihydrofolate synthase / folylpolyglutamate synthase